MRSHSLQWLRLLLIAVLLLAAFPVAALAQGDGSEGAMQGEVVAEGFNGPMGVLVDSSGDIWVVDSGTGGDQTMEGTTPDGQPVTASMGMTSRVVKVSGADGSQTEIATLPSINTGLESEGGSRLAVLRGITYVTAPGWHPTMAPSTAEEPLPLTGGILRVSPSGEAVEAVPMWQYEKNNDTDNELDNHPYGLMATDDGALLMTDAGGNALYRVNPASHRAKLLATFDPLPGVFPNPKYNNEMLTDAVPTGVAMRDGVIYVGFLSGAPFLPGNAKVVTVADDGTVADYATGLTMLTDLRTGPDGELYAVQFGMANEQGFVPNSGALLRIKEGDASEVLVSGLSFPTSIDFDTNGNAYVTTNGVGAPGSGQLLRFAELSYAKGTPISEGMAGGPPAGADMGSSEEMTGTETMTDTTGAGDMGSTEEMTGTMDSGDMGSTDMGSTDMGSTEAMTGTEEMTGTMDSGDMGYSEAMTDTTDMGDMGDMGASDSVLVSDQESDGSSVTVDSTTAAADGWMVIHSDDNGKPGPVLGQTAVPAGMTDNVVVMLDPAMTAGSTLWAMLHVDAGEMGVYEFPGADVPVTMDGQVVMAPFNVTMSGGETMGAAAATEEAVAVVTAEATSEATDATAGIPTSDNAAATDQAPQTLPTTGGESAPLAVAVTGLALAALAGAAFVTRKRAA